MGKLVRDRIPDIIRDSGGDPMVRRMEIGEYHSALLAKLREECEETIAARADNDELIEELADVLEVLRAIANTRGHAWRKIEQAARSKRDERGGFVERLWLE